MRGNWGKEGESGRERESRRERAGEREKGRERFLRAGEVGLSRVKSNWLSLDHCAPPKTAS